MLDDSHQETQATIEIYLRVSCLGRCIITEMHSPASIRKAFYAREESDDYYEYQFRELSSKDVESFHWGSATVLPPLHPDKLTCHCKIEEKEEATQTTEKKKKRKHDDYAARLAQVRKLLEMMKEMRKNRPEITAHGQEPKKTCPITPTISTCLPATTSCFVSLSSTCPTSCQPTAYRCLPPPC